MGTYIPAGPPRNRSVSDTLLEAEEEHFLDCPDADLRARAAAMLLDIIFAYLIYSALQRVQRVAVGYFVVSPSLEIPTDGPVATVIYFTYSFRIIAAYFYFLWSVVTFGGTPGKLLMGLRVLSADNGKRLGMPRVLLREIVGKAASLLVIVGLLLPLVRRDRRALHDLISGSVVKRVQGEA